MQRVEERSPLSSNHPPSVYNPQSERDWVAWAYFSAALARSSSAVRGGKTEWRWMRPMRMAASARWARAAKDGACLRPQSGHTGAELPERRSCTPAGADISCPHKPQGSFRMASRFSSRNCIIEARLEEIKVRIAHSLNRPLWKENRLRYEETGDLRPQGRTNFRTPQALPRSGIGQASGAKRSLVKLSGYAEPGCRINKDDSR